MGSDQITLGINNRGLRHNLPDGEEEANRGGRARAEQMVQEYFPIAGADCANAQFKTIFDRTNIEASRLPA